LKKAVEFSRAPVTLKPRETCLNHYYSFYNNCNNYNYYTYLGIVGIGRSQWNICHTQAPWNLPHINTPRCPHHRRALLYPSHCTDILQQVIWAKLTWRATASVLQRMKSVQKVH